MSALELDTLLGFVEGAAKFVFFAVVVGAVLWVAINPAAFMSWMEGN